MGPGPCAGGGGKKRRRRRRKVLTLSRLKAKELFKKPLHQSHRNETTKMLQFQAMPLQHQVLLTSKVGFLALLQTKFWVSE